MFQNGDDKGEIDATHDNKWKQALFQPCNTRFLASISNWKQVDL